jgi:PIN domain nuclease of toxin-antitoxin system
VILVDTQVVLWLAFEPLRLSTIKHARKNGEVLAISDITLLEIATLVSKGRVSLAIAPEQFLHEVENAFGILPISARVCARILTFPSTFPKDPADRIITATALVEGLTLITADQEIHRAKLVRTIW